MADIDKGLPNTRAQIEIPSDEELQEVAVQDENVEELKGPVEVIPEEDGGATIDYEPGAINVPGTEAHFDNLADILPEGSEEHTSELQSRLHLVCRLLLGAHV